MGKKESKNILVEINANEHSKNNTIKNIGLIILGIVS